VSKTWQTKRLLPNLNRDNEHDVSAQLSASIRSQNDTLLRHTSMVLPPNILLCAWHFESKVVSTLWRYVGRILVKQCARNVILLWGLDSEAGDFRLPRLLKPALLSRGASLAEAACSTKYHPRCTCGHG
jgi:hypothetical protein